MSTAKLRYRGIPYNEGQHEHPSTKPVEHTYRGHRFVTPLCHPPSDVDPSVELQYRGIAYHHSATPGNKSRSRN